MPYRRKKSSKRVVVKTKPRRYYRRRHAKLSLKASPVPYRFFTKIVYAETGNQIGVAPGSSNAMIMSANGLYDPQITFGGHQPLGFDQLMAMYNHYTVIGSKIYVTFSNLTTNYNYECGISVLDGATQYTTPSRYKELQNTVWTAGTNSSQGSYIKSLSNKISIPKFLGKARKGFLGDDVVQGSITANPTEQVYYHIWAQGIEAAADLTYIDTSVRIEYLVVFHGPTDIAQS